MSAYYISIKNYTNKLINEIREMAFWYNQANSHIHTREKRDKEPKYRR